MTITIVQTAQGWLVLTDNGGTRLIRPTTFAKALAFVIEYYSVILTLSAANETARRIPDNA